jgi:hypothetical protein
MQMYSKTAIKLNSLKLLLEDAVKEFEPTQET